MTTKTTATVRPVYEIADEIYKDWSRQPKGISPQARQQLDAMFSLTTVDDNYYYDSGRMVIGSFLSNCSRWKGDKARAIKKELRNMLGLR